jgi:hypothetical protein
LSFPPEYFHSWIGVPETLRPPVMFAQYELKLVSEIVTVDCAAAGLAVPERIPPSRPPASSKLANIESQPAAFLDERH